MSSAGRPDCWLIYHAVGQSRRIHVQKGDFRIGRSEDCGLTLPGSDVSRWHATVDFKDGAWVISDHRSKNGLWVNGKKVYRWQLKNNDQIKLGPHDLSCEIREIVAAREPAAAAKAAAPPKLAVVEEDSGGTISARIDMEEFNSVLKTGLDQKKVVETPTTTGAPDKASAGGRSPLTQTGGLQGGAWVVGLFNEASEALLACENLDTMLQKVLELVFKHMPAQRGMVGLADEETGEIRPMVSRTTGRNPEETIQISRHIRDAAVGAKQAVLVKDTGADERFNPVVSIQIMKIRSAMCAPLYRAGKVEGIIYVDTQHPIKAFGETHLHILSTLAVLSAVAVEKVRLRENIARESKIRENLSRYFAPGVIERIIRDSTHELHAEEREASILFADLSGFTAMSENLEPSEVARILNGAFEELSRAVFELEGTLDKFMGDGLMAIFGAPYEQKDHARRAVQASLRMLRYLAGFNDSQTGNPRLAIRIGINSGMVVAGDLGSKRRRDYTVIGDAVNVASRLESSVAKPGQIVIGSTTFEAVQNVFHCQPMPAVALKGKTKKIEPYLVLGERFDQPADPSGAHAAPPGPSHAESPEEAPPGSVRESPTSEMPVVSPDDGAADTRPPLEEGSRPGPER